MKDSVLKEKITTGVAVFILFCIGALACPLYAQSYPNRPIQLVLPNPPGATTDLVGRIIAPELSARLGQPIVMENRPGAGGDIGVEQTARASPDGHTLVLTTNILSLRP